MSLADLIPEAFWPQGQALLAALPTLALALALGVAGILCKPFDPMTLPDQVRDIWRGL